MNLNTIIYYIGAYISLINMTFIVARFSGKKIDNRFILLISCLVVSVIVTLTNSINMIMLRMTLSVIAVVIISLLNILNKVLKRMPFILALYGALAWFLTLYLCLYFL